MPRCAVLGSPIAHSLSPIMHRAGYAELGLSDWTYDAFDVAEDDLAGFLQRLDGSWRGLSLTMPLKRTVIPMLDEVGATADEAGTANTVLVEDGRLIGENTDVGGAVEALAEHGIRDVVTARILGAGATAASVGIALHQLGATMIDLRMRDRVSGRLTTELLEWIGLDVTAAALTDPGDEPVDLLVSTIPARSFGADVTRWTADVGAVFDVVYDPWPTPLAQAAGDAGLTFVSGLDLLAHQAALQLALMTGRSVIADVLREAARAELAS